MDYKEFRIKFSGCELLTWISDQSDGDALIAPRHIAEAIGLEWSRQCKKIMSDQKFNCVHMYTVGADGKKYEMLAIPVRQLTGWLYSINAKKVREDLREGLLRYQEECHVAIHDTLTGRANRGLVEAQAAEIANLRKLMQDFMAETAQQIAELRQENAWLSEQLLGQSDIEASYAGKKLAARKRHLKAL